MNIIPFRIVLDDGTVIRPEHVVRTSRLEDGDVIVHYMPDGEMNRIPARILEPGNHRLDLTTGEVDSTGREIFKNDRVENNRGHSGVVIYHCASWEVMWDNYIF